MDCHSAEHQAMKANLQETNAAQALCQVLGG
jgi:hypothetical protein